MSTIEVKVPDIGDFRDVPVIEVFVKPGDAVKPEDSLITLESDKATMDVPSPSAGVVKDLKLRVGDKVSEGGLILTLETNGAGAARQATSAKPSAAATPSPSPAAAPPRAAAPSPSSSPSPAKAGAMQDVKVPDIGDFKDVPVIEVFVTAGDTVKVDDALVTLESDKATMDVPSPSAGVIKDVKLKVGDKVSEGSVILVLETEAQGAAPTPSAAATQPARSPAAAEAPAPPAPTQAAGPREQDRVPEGRPGVTGGGALNLLAWPQVDFTKFGAVESKPLSRIKKISGANLARNWVMIPHVTQFDDADITDLEAFRVALNKENEKTGIKLTMLAFLIKASVAALKKFPDFNASLDGDNLVYKRYFNIGFAADTPNGLVVPVIKNADQKGVLQIAQEMGELSTQAREGKLGPADMQGGCFSISSLGGIGGTAFTPIINAPEVAILGVSKSATKPVWDGKAFAPRLIVPLSLSYDHRVVDGAQAARFITYLGRLLADMRRVML